MAYVELTKFRLTLTSLLTVFTAFYMATDLPLDGVLLFHTLFGSALIGGGANALNQFFERAYDAKMPRTEKRPLPSGRLRPVQALLFGCVLAIYGTLHLFLFTNPKTAAFGLLTVGLYLFVYTPLKRVTRWNTLVGAVVGALPTWIGWTAADAPLDAKAWPIFLILFFWELPHFFAIAWVYRRDYELAGFKMLSVGDSGRKTAWAIAVSSVFLFAASLLPTWVGVTGLFYLTGAFFAGIFFLALAVYTASHKLAQARGVVIASIAYIIALNFFIFIDKA